MSLRGIILGTVAVNLALVGALLWQTARLPQPIAHAGLEMLSNVVTEIVNEPAAPKAEVKVAGSPPFRWSQVESTNYFTCATNLLAIGCPKETVRDILEARVADDFRMRSRGLTLPLQVRFWDAAAAGDVSNIFDGSPLEEQMEALNDEREAILKELHGIVGETQPASPAKRNEFFAHVAAEQQSQLATLESGHAKALEALRREHEKLPAAEQRGTKLSAMRQRQLEERRALFSDGEWDEAELRRSPQARLVRELRGYTATADELRSLARSLRDFDSANPQPMPLDRNRPNDDPDYVAKRDARENARRDFITARFGAVGFAAFERGSDPRFHTLLKLARRLEFAPAFAVNLLAVQTTASEQARMTQQNAEFDNDARALVLRAIHAETERTLRAAVGERGWGAYVRNAGEWLKQLGQ